MHVAYYKSLFSINTKLAQYNPEFVLLFAIV